MTDFKIPLDVKPVEPPIVQFDSAQAPFLVEVDKYVRAGKARKDFKVSGKGLCAAILDTGLNTQHVDFAGRIAAVRNFTTDNNGDLNDVTDGNGHGTNVAGIVAAGDEHVGMAPGANVAALKVLRNHGGGSFAWVEQALDWVLQNQAVHNIGVVCMSLGDGNNYVEDGPLAAGTLAQKIAALRQANVAVVVAAGNEYYTHASKQGMSYPAIIRDTVSVGAVYDAAVGAFSYSSGARANSTRAGQITPFSQRLHPTINSQTYTDIFAPGAPVTSSGINGPKGESIQHGTSQAAPVTAGIILLLQEFYQRHAGELPSVEQLIGWLRSGAPDTEVVDSMDLDDNVQHTGLTFLRVDALKAMEAAYQELVLSHIEISS